MNTIENTTNATIDQQALEAYVRKRLKEEVEKRGTPAEIRIESLRVIGNLLIIFVLGLFIVSPFVQMILRAINGLENEPLMVTSGYVRYYQWTIHNTHIIARFTAVIVLVWLILYSIVRKRSGKSADSKLSKKALFSRLLPIIIFLLFALSIALVTINQRTQRVRPHGAPLYVRERVQLHLLPAGIFLLRYDADPRKAP